MFLSVWRLQTLGSFGGSFFTDGWRPKKGISKKWLLFLQIITLLLPGGVAQRGESWSGQRVVTFNKNIIYNFGYSFSHRHPILIEFQFCTGLLVVGIKFIQRAKEVSISDSDHYHQLWKKKRRAFEHSFNIRSAIEAHICILSGLQNAWKQFIRLIRGRSCIRIRKLTC